METVLKSTILIFHFITWVSLVNPATSIEFGCILDTFFLQRECYHSQPMKFELFRRWRVLWHVALFISFDWIRIYYGSLVRFRSDCYLDAFWQDFFRSRNRMCRYLLRFFSRVFRLTKVHIKIKRILIWKLFTKK